MTDPQPLDERSIHEQLGDALHESNLSDAKAMLESMHVADVADVIAALPKSMWAIAFRLLTKNQAIQVYEYLEPPIQHKLLAEFKRQEVIDIIDQMSPDDRAQLFDELPATLVRRLLQELSPAERRATALLMGYRLNTAGRRMTPEYVALRAQISAAEALDRVRQVADQMETVYTLYAVDSDRHLIGSLSLRDLVTAQPNQQIGDIMTRDVVFVDTDTDQEVVAQMIQHYDLLSLPVVDRERRLVGIVTVDDVLDIVEQESTEDIYAQGGLQTGGDRYFQTSLLAMARKRVVWLFVLLIANSGTVTVIQNQEALLEQVVALAAFIPLLIDAGGNIGAQSSTVVIRGLNTAEIRLKQFGTIIRREAIAGALLGIMLGVVVIGWAYLIHQDWEVAVSVGLSLAFVSVLASTAGAALPLLFQVLNFDPALMSAPFITTIIDVLGVMVYLAIARRILGLSG